MCRGPLITLNNGVRMPSLGFGTLDRSAVEQAAGAVQYAIANGYRLIDTAASYGDERQVGEGIRAGGIDRSEMFITTKLWMGDYGYESTLRHLISVCVSSDSTTRYLSTPLADAFKFRGNHSLVPGGGNAHCRWQGSRDRRVEFRPDALKDPHGTDRSVSNGESD